jgi:serine/threonine protein kinase
MLSDYEQTVPEYFLLRELARGEVGVIYVARHRSEEVAATQGEVALKVIHRHLMYKKELIERFEEEARTLKGLDHPGIIGVHELLMPERSRAMVMDLAQGRTLDTIIDTQTGPMAWTRAQQIISKLCDAVAHLHAHDVFHRDLKPDNVILTEDDQPVLLDLGLTKKLAMGRTRTGKGFVPYLAPEQHNDPHREDVSSNLYALGMMLYEMVAGRLPWDKHTLDYRVLKLKESGEIPPPSDFAPSIPPHIVDAVMAAIACEPSDRPASVAELRDLLIGPPGAYTEPPPQRAPEPAATFTAAPAPPPPEPHVFWPEPKTQPSRPEPETPPVPQPEAQTIWPEPTPESPLRSEPWKGVSSASMIHRPPPLPKRRGLGLVGKLIFGGLLFMGALAFLESPSDTSTGAYTKSPERLEIERKRKAKRKARQEAAEQEQRLLTPDSDEEDDTASP